MKYVLGIDVSTTAAKALLLGEDGAVATVASTPHGSFSPHPQWSEQDPADWWTGVQASIQRATRESGINAKQIAGIGLTGQMHGLVLLNEAGDVPRPAILWNDQRTEKQCETIRETVGLNRLVQITGNDALPGFTAPKMLWVLENEPEIAAQTSKILLPKDYIRYLLSGSYATDKAGAGGTLLLDLKTRDWSSVMLEELGIPRKWLPSTYEGTEITGVIDAKAAEVTGLMEGTPIVAGAGDQAAQAVGVGALREEVWALTVGTSGVVFAPGNQPLSEQRGILQAFPHATKDKWHMMGVMLSAAGSLTWFRNTLAPDAGYDELMSEASPVPPGSEGLFFQPYLTGERTPHNDATARGAFVGLTSRHRRGHLTRSVLEGVAFGLKDVFRLMIEAGLEPPARVRISGGGAQSELWCQIIADVLGVGLETLAHNEGAAFGAALLAGTGVGFWDAVDAAVSDAVEVGSNISPDPATQAAYEALYTQYRELYPMLAPFYRDLIRSN